MKIGVDMIRISRIEKVLSDKEAVRKIFSAKELGGSSEHMAGIFAAKEAYKKALGCDIPWQDIKVAKKEDGQPFFKNNKQALLSISHEREYAVAFVVVL